MNWLYYFDPMQNLWVQVDADTYAQSASNEVDVSITATPDCESTITSPKTVQLPPAATGSISVDEVGCDRSYLCPPGFALAGTARGYSLKSSSGWKSGCLDNGAGITAAAILQVRIGCKTTFLRAGNTSLVVTFPICPEIKDDSRQPGCEDCCAQLLPLIRGLSV